MKVTICLLAILCLPASDVQGQKEKSTYSRIIFSPPAYIKAEAFVEMTDENRTLYTIGLVDGFLASSLFGATDETIANLKSCVKDMDGKQITAVITKHVNDHPETWNSPLSIEAFNALNGACPGGLKVIHPKN